MLHHFCLITSSWKSEIKKITLLLYEWRLLQPLGETEADEIHQLPRVGVAGQVQLQLPPI